MQFIIYKLTCKVTGLSYIGQTKQKLSTRLSKHKTDITNTRISRAIAKYGFNNFSKEVLATCSTQTEVNSLEIYYINKFNTISPDGYNIHSGGHCGFKLTEEQKQRRSASAKKTCKKTKITVVFNNISISFVSIYETADFLKCTPSAIHLVIKRPDRRYKDCFIFKAEEYGIYIPKQRHCKHYSPTRIIDTHTGVEWVVLRQKDVKMLDISRDSVQRYCNKNVLFKNRFIFNSITHEEYENHINKIPPQ